MARFPYGLTITVERPTGTDRHGNPQPPNVHKVEDCATAPPGTTALGTSESTIDAMTVVWDLDLLAPIDCDIKPQDSVVLSDDPQPEDERFQVFGQPRRYSNPFTGWRAGTVVRLKGAEG